MRECGPVSAAEPEIEVELEPEPRAAEEPVVALALYAPEGEALALGAPRIVDQRSVEVPRVLDPRLVMLRDPESAQARSFRLLAHRLRHTGDPRVIAVTSPRRGEGKTTTAINLALALAEDGGARVLLLEANAKTPIHAALFGLDNVVGLPRQMARLTTALVPWTAYELCGTGLSVLPAEPSDAVAPSRGVFQAAIGDLRMAFDYVIVDAPSALESADVMALVDSVDAVLIAARARRTRGREIDKVTKQLAPANVAGVVLLDVKEAAKS